MTGKIQNVPTSPNEPSSALGCPYASATETATTVPGNAHGIRTSNDNNRRHPSPKNLDDVRARRRNNVTIQKLHTSAAAAAIADIVKLLKKTSAACGSLNSRW